MAAPRFFVRLLLMLASVGALAGCARAEAPDTAAERAEARRATSETKTPSGDDQFARLRARPLRAAAPRPGAGCPDPSSQDIALVPSIPAEVARGIGPVYFAFPGIPRFLDFFPPTEGGSVAGRKWRSAEVAWASDAGYSGPVLVRGRKVNARSRVGFGSSERPELELRLPAGRWAEADERLRIWGRPVRPAQGWRVAVVDVRVREGGCYFLQIDGTSFSERGILFGAIWQP
jgi:hypothetical protein